MRYVAIGDSFTEGVGDERADGSVRGWADLVAQGLAVARGEPVHYANLAVRGRLLEPIVTEQLEAALALDPVPTTITLNGGGNDMMRPGMDAARLVGLTERAVRRCLDAGVDLVLISGPDPSDRLPFGSSLRRRGDLLTEAIHDLGRRHRLTVVDVFHDTEIRRAAYWSHDRLHLNADGHRRVASLVLRGLGYSVDVPLAPADPAGGGLRHEARYYREHVFPWLQRRLRGRSSGDGRVGKHLDWVVVEPVTG